MFTFKITTLRQDAYLNTRKIFLQRVYSPVQLHVKSTSYETFLTLSSPVMPCGVILFIRP
jgi:hypothetical protein